MATTRFSDKPKLTNFDKPSVPVTDGNDGKDYQMGGEELGKVLEASNYAPSKAEVAERAKSLTAIGEGRNLIDVMGASSVQDCFQKIRALGTDYSKLQLGDYIDIPSITVDGIGTLQNASHNLRVEIAGFDHYYNVGDTATGRGILFVFRNCAFTHGMNSTNVNEGGYHDCELKPILNGAMAQAIESALGVSLKTVHRLVDTHGNWAWTGEKCFLPTEIEIFGYQAWGRGGYYGGTSVQYPIYALDPSRRCKKYNGNRQWYWEGTSDSTTSAHFCSCGSYGNASSYDASNAYGVSPAFYL